MGVYCTVSGSFDNVLTWLKNMNSSKVVDLLHSYGKKGVEALKMMTPVDTGKTADSWYYELVKEGPAWSLKFCNSNIVDGFSVVIGLQYGHGTRLGYWVEGRDFINPAIQPVFDEMSEQLVAQISGIKR